jgi:hypothetical protein
MIISIKDFKNGTVFSPALAETKAATVEGDGSNPGAAGGGMLSLEERFMVVHFTVF